MGGGGEIIQTCYNYHTACQQFCRYNLCQATYYIWHHLPADSQDYPSEDGAKQVRLAG